MGSGGMFTTTHLIKAPSGRYIWCGLLPNVLREGCVQSKAYDSVKAALQDAKAHGVEVCNIEGCACRQLWPRKEEVAALSSWLDKFKPRRPWIDDQPDGYLESDQDFINNNLVLVLEILERLEELSNGG
jgi:hypothetical protein